MPKEPSPVNLTNDIITIADALHSAFNKSASFSYFLKKVFNIGLAENFSSHRNKAIMYYYASMYSDLGGEVVECDDFNAVALVCPPGSHIDFSETKDTRFNKIWYEDYDETLESFIGETPFYYICLVGRNFNQEKKKGSVTKIFKHYMKMADLRKCPIVLEAISDDSRQIYEHYGFKTLHSFKYGENEVNERGELDSKGEGFTAYLMIYYSGDLEEYKNSGITDDQLIKIDPKTYEPIVEVSAVAPTSLAKSQNLTIVSTSVDNTTVPATVLDDAVPLRTGIAVNKEK
ncbi:hypothetical protein ACO0SA_000229 [Hanseniaspora valbyensis]